MSMLSGDRLAGERLTVLAEALESIRQSMPDDDRHVEVRGLLTEVEQKLAMALFLLLDDGWHIG